MISVIEIDECKRDYWDTEIAKFDNVHPLNAYGWGKVRAVDGWSPTYLMAKRDTSITGAVILLTKRIPFTRFSIMYAPRAPVFDLNDRETLESLISRICLEAKKRRSIFLRIDPNFTEKAVSDAGDPFSKEGFMHLKERWSMWNAPRDVYRTDLTRAKDEYELFMCLSPKARTGVRKSQKDGVIIRKAVSVRDVAAFFRIFKQFAIEKGFFYRSFKYQKLLWSEYISRENGILLLSEYEGSVVGGQICLRLGPMCVEMHRSVLYEHHKHRINEALVWEGIKWAQKSGCRLYCQRGKASPSLSAFKKKFGSDLIELTGYYDLPFYPILYSWVCILEFRVLPRLVSILVKHLKKLRELWI